MKIRKKFMSIVVISALLMANCGIISTYAMEERAHSDWYDNKVNKTLEFEKDDIVYKVLDEHRVSVEKVINNGTGYGDQMFYFDEELRPIKIPETIKSPDGKEYLVTEIKARSFDNCRIATSITIPDSVTKIGFQAFHNCTNVESITLSSNITEILYETFNGCYSLKTVNIPHSVRKIEKDAFKDCKQLIVTIPLGIKVEGKIFDDCGFCDLNSDLILTAEKVQKILQAMPSEINNFHIPCGITKIDDEAFSGMKKTDDNKVPKMDLDAAGNPIIKVCCKKIEGLKIKKITIPDTVTEIGDSAFRNCSALEEISIPGSVQKIGEHAFEGSSIKRIHLVEGIISIGQFAFNNCIFLEKINENSVLPRSVKEIGDCAFAHIPKINKLIISGEKTKVSQCAFMQNDQRIESLTIQIPRSTIWKVEEGIADFAGSCIVLRNDENTAATATSSTTASTQPTKDDLLRYYGDASLINERILEFLHFCNVNVKIIDSDSSNNDTTALYRLYNSFFSLQYIILHLF